MRSQEGIGGDDDYRLADIPLPEENRPPSPHSRTKEYFEKHFNNLATGNLDAGPTVPQTAYPSDSGTSDFAKFFRCYSDYQKTIPFLTRKVDLKGRPKEKKVTFPPFCEFLAFIQEISQIKNDPGFMYNVNNNQEKLSSTGTQNRLWVYVKKTEVTRNQVKGDTDRELNCILHANSKKCLKQM